MMTRLVCVICLSVAAWGQAAGTTGNTKPTTPPVATVISSPNANNPLASAQELFSKGEYQQAATAFKAIVEKTADSAEAQAGLVRSLLQARKFDEANDAAKKAIAAIPSSALVQAAAGDVFFRAGKLGEAEAAYRAAVKADSNSARGLFGIGRIYDMVSMHKHARDIFTRAHELDPADDQIYEEWLDLLTPGEQLEAVKKRAGEHPKDVEAERLKYLNAISGKKPWAMSTEVKPMEIKVYPYGKEQTGVYDINRSGPITISKGYGLQVKFNNRASAVLLLDTGASGIIIGNKLAEKAGAVKIADTFIGGIGDKGPIRSYLAWIDNINIGGLQFHDCVVVVSSKNDVADEAGLIGADVFDKFLVTLDFRNWRVLLAPLPRNPSAPADDAVAQDRYIAPEMQSFTKFYRFGHDIVVPVVVNDKAVGNFILDTGADLNTMSPEFAAQVTKARDDHDYVMKGVSGKVSEVLTGQKAILQVAGMRIESHDLPVFSTYGASASTGTEIAGFIGIRTLVQMKMTIDYRDGLVKLEVYEFKKARE